MRSRIASLLLTIGLVPVAGCSLLIDTGPYVGSGDAGPDTGVVDPPDGGDRDAMVDPNGPSAPGITIAPETPRTGDELVASITTESVDPLDTGAVTYEWSWTVDEADADETAMTISADRTEKDQVWTVSVTPIASDGRRGAAGTASVTIANSPPTVRYVRLDAYRPILGDIVLASAGPTTDPDGDAVGLRYAWYLNDTVIAGEVSNRLDTGDVTAAPGDRIRVELTSRDPDGDGNTVTAGPAITLADETRWRQLLPNRTWGSDYLVAHDPQNERVLMLYATGEDGTDVRMWEYALDGSGAFTQLFPTGPEPTLGFATPIWDEERQRILFVGGVSDIDGGEPESDIFVLDVSQRGGETFSVISPLGTAPPPRVWVSAALDAERDRLLFYGGIGFVAGGDGVPLNDFWTLDLSTAGGETWTEQTIPLPPATIVGGALVVDAPRDRALLVAGAEYAGGSGEPPTSMSIYTVDLEDLSSGFFAGGTIPEGAGRYFGTAGLDAPRDQLLVGYGTGQGEVAQTDIIEIDLASLSATSMTPGGEVPPTGGRGFLVPHEDALLLFVDPVFSDGDGQFDLFELDPDADVITAVHRTGEDLPPGLRKAAAGDRYRGMTIFGGEDQHQTVRDEVWQYDDGTFTRLVVTPDALDGTTPGPRTGLSVQSSSSWGSGLTFFGGLAAINPEGFATPDVWTLVDDFDSTTWLHRTLDGAPPMPSPRHGAATYRGGCSLIGMVGGSDQDGLLGEHWRLQCSGDRSCHWETDPAGTLFPAREYATATRLSSANFVIAYGGRSGSTVLDELRTYRDCAGAQSWSVPIIAGTAPPARWGHTMVPIEDFSSGSVERQIVFAGSGTWSDYDPLADVHVLTIIGETGDPPQLSVRWDPLVVASGVNDESVPPRIHHVATWDSDNERMLVYGGYASNAVLSDLWELRYRPAPP